MAAKELIFEDDYFEFKSDERVYLDLRDCSGYVTEAEKLSRNNPKTNFHIMLK